MPLDEIKWCTRIIEGGPIQRALVYCLCLLVIGFPHNIYSPLFEATSLNSLATMRADKPCFLIFQGFIGPTINSSTVKELSLHVDALPCTLGRAPTSLKGPGLGKHLLVDEGDTTLSREHANLTWNSVKGCYEIECLSKNGIVINNVRILKGQVAEVHLNTALRLGSARLYTSLPVGLVEGPLVVKEKVVKKRKTPSSTAATNSAVTATTNSAAFDGNDWIESGDCGTGNTGGGGGGQAPASKRAKADPSDKASSTSGGSSDAGGDSKYFLMLTQAFASGDLPEGPEGASRGNTQAQLNSWITGMDVGGGGNGVAGKMQNACVLHCDLIYVAICRDANPNPNLLPLPPYPLPFRYCHCPP